MKTIYQNRALTKRALVKDIWNNIKSGLSSVGDKISSRWDEVQNYFDENPAARYALYTGGGAVLGGLMSLGFKNKYMRILLPIIMGGGGAYAAKLRNDYRTDRRNLKLFALWTKEQLSKHVLPSWKLKLLLGWSNLDPKDNDAGARKILLLNLKEDQSVNEFLDMVLGKYPLGYSTKYRRALNNLLDKYDKYQ